MNEKSDAPNTSNNWVSYIEVEKACNLLLSKDKSLSANNVRDITKNGGGGRIQKFINEFKNKNAELINTPIEKRTLNIPEIVRSSLDTTIESLWVEAQSIAKEEFSIQKDELLEREIDAKETVDNITIENENLVKTVNTLIQDKLRLEKKDDKQAIKINKLMQEVISSKEIVSQTEYKLNNSNTEVQLLIKKLNESEKITKENKLNYEKSTQEFKNKNTILAKELEKSEFNNKELSTLTDSNNFEIKELTTTINNVKLKLDKYINDNKVLQNSYQDILTDKKISEAIIEEKNKSYSDLKSDMKALRDNEKTSAEKIIILQSKLDRLNKETAGLQNKKQNTCSSEENFTNKVS